jgi:hypothetical protein
MPMPEFRKAVWEAARASLLTTVALVNLGKDVEEADVTSEEGAALLLRLDLEAVVDSMAVASKALAPITGMLAAFYALDVDEEQTKLPLEPRG